jgi:arginyl-tRNA synthetase
MASTSAPNGASAAAIPERYALPTFPETKSADPDREPMDAFKLAAAKLIADAWQEPLDKIFDGVDTGEYYL